MILTQIVFITEIMMIKLVICNSFYSFVDSINNIENYYSLIDSSIFNFTIPTVDFQTQAIPKKVVFSYGNREFISNHENVIIESKYTNVSLIIKFDLLFVFQQPFIINSNSKTSTINVYKNNVIGILTFAEKIIIEKESQMFGFKKKNNSLIFSYLDFGNVQEYEIFQNIKGLVNNDTFNKTFSEIGESIMDYVISLYPNKPEQLFIDAMKQLQQEINVTYSNKDFIYKGNFTNIRYLKSYKPSGKAVHVYNTTFSLSYDNGNDIIDKNFKIDMLLVTESVLMMIKLNTTDQNESKYIKEIFNRFLFLNQER